MSEWTIREPFGRRWPPQVLWREIDAIEALPPVVDLVVDGDQGVGARIVPAQVDGGRLAFIGELGPGQTRRYRLTSAPRAGHADTPPVAGQGSATALLNVQGDRARAAALCLAWSGADPATVLRGLQRADGTWAVVSNRWIGCHVERRLDEVLADGPVLSRLRQTFRLDGGAALQLTWEVDAASTSIRLDIVLDRALAGRELVLQLGDVCRPERAYWRPHSPRAWRGERGDSHHRQVYTVPGGKAPGGPGGEDGALPATDELEIGPFYNWARDAAPFWSCWGETSSSLLYVGWVRPSRTRLPDGMRRLRLQATVDPSTIDLHIPLQRGCHRLALAVVERTNLSSSTEGAGNDIDALHTQLNGPSLDDLQRMDLEAAARTQGSFPRLWLSQGDIPAVRERLAAWPWLRSRFEAHVDDLILDSSQHPDLALSATPRTLGQDPAGAFLASGDAKWATAALAQLTAQLDDVVDTLLDYGPSVDRSLGISLARTWRALLVNLDLVLGAPGVRADQRARILRQLAFVAEAQWTDDAWPADDSGIPRGNDNFHPDVVSARGLAAALLDGHPRQAQWLAAAVAEMGAFLQRYHLPSGACRESATYQLVSLGFALQLHAAAARRGHDDLARLPVLQRAFEFLAATQTPVDERCGYRMLPTVGHVTVYGWCQTLQTYFAWAAQATAGTAFSERMMRAWQRGGGHVVSLHDYHQSSIWSQPLLLLDRALPAAPDDDDLARSRVFGGLGAVLRAHHADGSEGYLLAKMGECHGHFDQDEGSFLWYAWGQPLLADFGTQYDPNFHAHPWLHNRLSFDHKADAPPRHGRLLAHRLDDGVDYLCGEVRVRSQFFHGEWPDRDSDYDFRQAGDPWELEAPQAWRRHLVYVHALEAVVLLDEVDSTLPTDWNLQVHADSVRTVDSTAHFTGRFGVDLQVHVLRPTAPRLATSGYSHLGFDEPRGAKWWWRAARWTTPAGTRMTAMAEQGLTLRAHAEAGEPYFAALVARRSGQPPATIEALGAWGVRIATSAGAASVTTTAPFERWEVVVEMPAGTKTTQIDGRRSGHSQEAL